MDEIDISEKDMEFIMKVVEVCKDAKRDTEIPFTCPICGGEASAFVSSYNGHKHANCKKCETYIME